MLIQSGPYIPCFTIDFYNLMYVPYFIKAKKLKPYQEKGFTTMGNLGDVVDYVE